MACPSASVLQSIWNRWTTMMPKTGHIATRTCSNTLKLACTCSADSLTLAHLIRMTCSCLLELTHSHLFTLAQLIRATRSRLLELTCTCSSDPLTLAHTCSTDSLTPTQLTQSHLLKPASTARWFSKPVRLLSLRFLSCRLISRHVMASTRLLSPQGHLVVWLQSSHAP